MRSFVLDSLDDLKDYRDAWEGLRQECRAPIFSSYDLVYLWLDNYSASVKPCVILIEDRGELIGVAPLCTSQHWVMGLPINTISMVGVQLNLMGYSLYSVFARHDESATLREMLGCVKRAKWNFLLMPALDTNISTLRFQDGICQETDWHPANPDLDRSYVFPPEGDIAADFGKRTRKNLNTIRNKLEREGRMDFQSVKSVEDAERAMRLYLGQHEERWEKKGGSIVRKPNNSRLLVEMGKLAVKTGTGTIHELLIDGEVAGQVLCFFDGDVSRAYRQGMTDKFWDLSPGRLVMTLAMEDHRNRGLRAMDFLHGNEEYKLHMTNNQRALGSVQMTRGPLKLLSRAREFPPLRGINKRLMSFQDHMMRRAYDD